MFQNQLRQEETEEATQPDYSADKERGREKKEKEQLGEESDKVDVSRRKARMK